MGRRPDLLTDIITRAENQKRLQTPLRAVFDLDSTLFDVSPRITKILHIFAADAAMRKRYPRECAFLEKIESHSSDYGVRRTLERSGFPPPDDSEFKELLVNFWMEHFFSNRFLDADVPYEGAQRFVNDLYNAGADILYLSGRDVPRMKEGSIAALRHHGFPLDKNHANLILKPNTTLKDTEFKRDFFINLDGGTSRKESVLEKRIWQTKSSTSEAWSSETWFFENEPAIIHLVNASSPYLNIVFVDTVHSGAAPMPHEKIPRINGFEI